MASVLRGRTTFLLLRRSCPHWGWTGNWLQPGSVPPGPPAVPVLLRCSDSCPQDFTLIYSLPHMRLLRAVSRLKLLQTGLTVLALPAVGVLHLQGSASLLLLGYSAGLALLAGAVLYTASHFFTRVVGLMYLDRAETTLQVAHLTFWGRRRDLWLPLDDVMTIGDTGDSESEPILRLRRFSTTDTLYFSTRFGRVLDRRRFQKVFGTSP